MDVLINAMGFLIALGVNGWIENRHELETFRSIRSAVVNEMLLNKSNAGLIMTGRRNMDTHKALLEGTVNDGVISGALANPVFIKHSPENSLVKLAIYADAIKQVNALRNNLASAHFSPESSAAAALQKEVGMPQIPPGLESNLLAFWIGSVEGMSANIKTIEQSGFETKER